MSHLGEKEEWGQKKKKGKREEKRKGRKGVGIKKDQRQDKKEIF